ncbi:helix-turn-helix domain-containing protein [Bradyrhizobium sp. G127]|jgi:chromosomal replication initiation ATPase DnaA|uniref:helix-turn-helix domain-containing protein n=1 Tax=Bradyrhizobium sp. G127 TaxID=2904800 RepID=UPI001F254F33|nr:helix-turn-helix domain-containing protein [Bradyrhizobium sp. G127]MCF2522984.1 DNA replication initiation protein [Bradyrhizobium sp. G127]
MLETRPLVAPFPLLHPETAAASPDDICRLVTACVAFDFGLDAAELEAGLRGSQRVAFARQIAMYLAHVCFELSFESVGRAFGRDRTTVAHACRVVEDGRDDIWFDCRIATLDLVCRAAIGGDAR